MNKTDIEWADYTWNPVTGCLHTCPYCYARQMAKRFSGDVRLNISDDRCVGDKEKHLFELDAPFIGRSDRAYVFPFGFYPTLHRYRLDWPTKVKNTANIFVGSMTDLFGEWVPDEWLKLVFETCEKYPHHNYMFLTKNPGRYLELAQNGELPQGDNYWYGTTTTTADAPYFYADGYNTFCSIEPLHGDFEPNADIRCNWLIIGAESGKRKGKIVPEPEWIQHIVDAAKAKGVPVFMKDSLIEIRGEKRMLRKMPEQLLNKPISDKLMKMLYGCCGKCGKRMAMKEMVSLQYREARGQWPKGMGYLCTECFEILKKELGINEDTGTAED